VPPPPFDENDLTEFPCWQCGATLRSVASFCWQCNAPVRACRNCAFMPEQRCKELQGLISPVTQQARNECPWWRPAVG
jgi:predicted amidophosphoribosyltransferase